MRVSSVERECGESVDQASALAGRTLARLRYAQVAGNLGDLSFQHVQAGVRAQAARGGGAQQRRVDAAHHGVGHDRAGGQRIEGKGRGSVSDRPSEVALTAISQSAPGAASASWMSSAG